MKNKIAWILLASLGSQLVLPIAEVFAVTPQESETMLIAGKANRGGGGKRSSGGGAKRSGGNLNRSSVGSKGSGRVQRDTAKRPSNSNTNRSANRDNRNVNRESSNRVKRPENRSVDRNQTRDRVNNSRDVNRDRNVNVDRNRNVNVDRNRTVNVNRDRNVIVNPRVGSAWGWNRGVAWVPRTNYWGGGFWGPFAVGAATVGMTSAIVNASSSNYYTVEQNTPGYSLLSNYSLVQTQCSDDPNLVYMYGPQDSLICANPNNLVPSGDYDIDIDTLSLVARY